MSDWSIFNLYRDILFARASKEVEDSLTPIKNLVSNRLPIPSDSLLPIWMLWFFLRVIFFDNTAIEKLWVVDKESCHFLFKKFSATSVIILLICKRWFIRKIWAFTVVGLKSLLWWCYLMLCSNSFCFHLFHSNFHIKSIIE